MATSFQIDCTCQQGQQWYRFGRLKSRGLLLKEIKRSPITLKLRVHNSIHLYRMDESRGEHRRVKTTALARSFNAAVVPLAERSLDEQELVGGWENMRELEKRKTTGQSPAEAPLRTGLRPRALPSEP